MTPVPTLLLLLAVAVRAPAGAQQGSLLDPAVRTHLHEELSGELAREHVIAITRHHRILEALGLLVLRESPAKTPSKD